jgi:hypothetical protein
MEGLDGPLHAGWLGNVESGGAGFPCLLAKAPEQRKPRMRTSSSSYFVYLSTVSVCVVWQLLEHLDQPATLVWVDTAKLLGKRINHSVRVDTAKFLGVADDPGVEPAEPSPEHPGSLDPTG